MQVRVQLGTLMGVCPVNLQESLRGAMGPFFRKPATGMLVIRGVEETTVYVDSIEGAHEGRLRVGLVDVKVWFYFDALSPSLLVALALKDVQPGEQRA